MSRYSLVPQIGVLLLQESMEFVESILADVDRLGLEYAKPITYTSDYFPQMLDLAERLIRAGHLYADDTPVEQMRAVRVPAPLHTSSIVWQKLFTEEVDCLLVVGCLKGLGLKVV